MFFLSILVILLVSPFIWWYWSIKKFRELDVIPGPSPLPFLGNVMDLGNSPQAIFHNMHNLIKKYGPICKFFIGAQPRILIADADILKELLSSKKHITKSNGYDLIKPWIGSGILVSGGTKWISHRKIITPSFHYHNLENFLDVFNSSASNFVEKVLCNKEPLDISPLMYLLSFDIICETAMGLKLMAQERKNEEYVHAVQDYLKITIKRMFSPWKTNDLLFKFSSDFKRNTECLHTLHKYSEKMIYKRREELLNKKLKNEKPNSLLDLLLASEENNLLSLKEIKEEIDTFMFAGHDTTASSLAFTLLNLANHQKVQAKLYTEIVSVIGADRNTKLTITHIQNLKYLEMIIKESQRMFTTVPFVERLIEREATLGGYNIPGGTILTCFFSGLHLSEAYFPEPQKFIPERFLLEATQNRTNFSFVPFSAGPRNCIGQRFALLEMKTIISKIIQSYRITALPNFKPDLGMAGILKSYNGIWMQFEKREKI